MQLIFLFAFAGASGGYYARYYFHEFEYYNLAATPSQTPSQTPTGSNTPTHTATPSMTATSTATPSITASQTASPSSTASRSDTASGTATTTASASSTQIASVSPTGTQTPSPSDTGSYTATSTVTPTNTASPSSTGSHSATATNTASNTNTPTGTPSKTGTATGTPTPTATATAWAVVADARFIVNTGQLPIALTKSTLYSEGAAWWAGEFYADGFVASMAFSVDTISSGGCADGIAFVIHRDPRGAASIGAFGNSVGYANGTNSISQFVAGIQNGYAMKFDTYNGATSSSMGPLIGRAVPAAAASVATTGLFDFCNGDTFTATLFYNAATQNMTLLMASSVSSRSYSYPGTDLRTALGCPPTTVGCLAWFGATASTSLYYARFVLNSMTFQLTYPTQTPTPSMTPSITPTPSNTPSASITASPTSSFASLTASPSNTASSSSTASNTGTQTQTPTNTATSSSTASKCAGVHYHIYKVPLNLYIRIYSNAREREYVGILRWQL